MISRSAAPRPEDAMRDLLPVLNRVLMLSVVLGTLAFGVLGLRYVTVEARLRQELAELERKMATEIAHRERMIERLAKSERKARIEVIEQQAGPDGFPSERDGSKVISTTVRFIELDADGREIGRREFCIPGDMLHVDAWTARFPKQSVAEGDPLRDRTLLLWRSIYSDRLPPADGFPIDTPGGIPDGYADGERSRLEQATWSGFWRLASDAAEARRRGIDVAQGEGVHKPVRKGEAYELRLDAAGGITMRPIDGRSLLAAEPGR
jgi:hypothetical protein